MRYMLFLLRYNVNNDGINAYHGSYEDYNEALDIIGSEYYKDNVYDLQLYDQHTGLTITGEQFLGNIEFKQLNNDIENMVVPYSIRLLVLDRRISWENYELLKTISDRHVKGYYYTLALHLTTEEFLEFVNDLTF